jgi:hypothetical protein
VLIFDQKNYRQIFKSMVKALSKIAKNKKAPNQRNLPRLIANILGLNGSIFRVHLHRTGAGDKIKGK